MNKSEAQQVFDGAMLSDAGVYFAHGGKPTENAYFNIGLSGWIHDDWLNIILTSLRILLGQDRINSISHRTAKRTDGQLYEYCGIITRTHPLLTNIRHKWYPYGYKQVPGDIRLTPLVLSHWFMGDGDSVWGASGLPNLVEARFGTYCFSRKEVDYLRELLKEFDINTSSTQEYKNLIHGDGYRIRIRNSSAVNKFMDLIEPYTAMSYQYKIKRPWLKKRGPKGGQNYFYHWTKRKWEKCLL